MYDIMGEYFCVAKFLNRTEDSMKKKTGFAFIIS